MKLLSKNVGLVASSAFSALLLSACGANSRPLIEAARLITENQDGHLYAELQTDIYTGNMQMPAIELPITHPHFGTMPIGKLGLKPRLSGGAEVSIGVDITVAADLPTLIEPKLPNGADLPIAGLEELNLIALPIQRTKAIAYFAVDPGRAVFGAAIPIVELDQVGAYVPGANLFYSYQFPNKLVGVGGVFTGDDSGETGIAIFMDLSKAIQAAIDKAKSQNGVAFMTSALSSAKPVQFKLPSLSNSKKNKLGEKLYKVSQKRGTVHLH